MSSKARVHVDVEVISAPTVLKMCTLEEGDFSPAGTIHLDYDFGEHEYALDVLGQLYSRARAKITGTIPVRSVGTENP